MKLTPSVQFVMNQVGYRPPIEPRCICKLCGAVGYNNEMIRRYFCKRHQIYVHSHGMCPSFSTEKFTSKRSGIPFVQTELFNNKKGTTE